MGAAVTDHVFVDDGHTIDFTNKAFEVLDHLGWDRMPARPAHARPADGGRRPGRGDRRPGVIPTTWLACSPGAAGRALPGASGRFGAGDLRRTTTTSTAWRGSSSATTRRRSSPPSTERLTAGATVEELARAVAYAAALRVTRFHTQNDHGDWDVVHHGFTSANAVHQLVQRAATPELARGVYQGALKVFLDRFLNVPAARLPGRPPSRGAARTGLGGLAGLLGPAGHGRRGRRHRLRMARSRRVDVRPCWRPSGRALLREDAEFHWFQTVRGRRPPVIGLAGGLRAGQRSSSPGRPASWPPTRRPAASCPRSCASRPGCGGAKPLYELPPE